VSCTSLPATWQLNTKLTSPSATRCKGRFGVWEGGVRGATQSRVACVCGYARGLLPEREQHLAAHCCAHVLKFG
jgi:hypothetical protein